MNTVSTAMSLIGMPGFKPMYVIARSAAARLVASAILPGSGTEAVIGRPWPGLVPHVTYGPSLVASMSTTLSNTASSSVFSVFQYATA